MNDEPDVHESGDTQALLISALMDGALSGTEADAALTAATQPEGQARWQCYHLIGDILRAPDLAAHHDAALLENVRAAMRQQPALTPESALLPAASRPEAANDRVFHWKLASGFASAVAVVAVGWNVWGFAGSPAGERLAQPAQPQVIASAARETDIPANAVAPDAQRLALDSSGGTPQQMLRDPQLDRLLAAHYRMEAFGGNRSAFLRNATFEEPER